MVAIPHRVDRSCLSVKPNDQAAEAAEAAQALSDSRGWDGETRSVAVFLGSGGHTGEALRLLSALDPRRFTPRTYIYSSGDSLSVAKAHAYEADILTTTSITKTKTTSPPPPPPARSTGEREYGYKFIQLPRARSVGQHYVSSIWTTLYSFWFTLWLLWVKPLWTSFHYDKRARPAGGKWGRGIEWDLLIVNGPGTCVVVVLVMLLPRLLSLHTPKIIYVESWARVTSLSLSGKMLRPLVDKFIVQWDKGRYGSPVLQDERSGDEPTVVEGQAGPRITELGGEYRGWLV